MKSSLILLLVLVLVPVSVLAEEACTETCAAGEKLVTFSDGNNVRCSCVKKASMIPTEPNLNLPDPEELHDEGQLIEADE